MSVHRGGRGPGHMCRSTGNPGDGGNLVPVISVAPAVTGTAIVGQTLSCTTGTWTNTPTSYAYQWTRNGSNIGSATSSTYVLVAADAGTSVVCVVTATNASGNSSPASSNTVSPTAFVPSTLYTGSDIGYAWDPTDLTHVWQTITGTGAGAFASVVGRVDDLSGLGNNWNASANDVTRPTVVNTNNGLLSFDGSDDKLLNIGGFYTKGAFTAIMAVKGAAAFTMLWAETNSGAGTNNPVYAPGTRANMLNYQRNDANSAISNTISNTLLDGSIHVLVVTDDGTHVKVSVAANAFVTDTYVRNSPLTVNRSCLGMAWIGNGTVFSAFNGNIGAGIVISRVLAGTLSSGGGEIANAYNWVAGKHGLTQL